MRDQLMAQQSALEREKAELESKQRATADRLEQGKLNFSQEQRAEFEAARKEADKFVAAKGDRSRELEHQVRSNASERARAQRDLREMTARRDQLQQRIAELTDQGEQLRAAVN